MVSLLVDWLLCSVGGLAGDRKTAQTQHGCFQLSRKWSVVSYKALRSSPATCWSLPVMLMGPCVCKEKPFQRVWNDLSCHSSPSQQISTGHYYGRVCFVVSDGTDSNALDLLHVKLETSDVTETCIYMLDFCKEVLDMRVMQVLCGPWKHTHTLIEWIGASVNSVCSLRWCFLPSQLVTMF